MPTEYAILLFTITSGIIVGLIAYLATRSISRMDRDVDQLASQMQREKDSTRDKMIEVRELVLRNGETIREMDKDIHDAKQERKDLRGSIADLESKVKDDYPTNSDLEKTMENFQERIEERFRSVEVKFGALSDKVTTGNKVSEEILAFLKSSRRRSPAP